MKSNNHLASIAQLAIKEYTLRVKDISFFTKATSIIYKVLDDDGKEWAMKIYHDSSNFDDNIIELLMVEQLCKEKNVITPNILKNKKEENVTIIPSTDKDSIYRIVLSEWLDGIDFKDNESEQYFIRLGELIAHIHNATQHITIPKDIQAKKWDRVFYFRNEVTVYHQDQYKGVVSPHFISIMDKAIPIFDQKLKKLYDTHSKQLLHGDLNPWNIKISNGTLIFMDFEDAVLGHPMHEIAILLYYYREHDQWDWKWIKDKIISGYQKVSDIGHIENKDYEFLMMARLLNLLNFVLTLDNDYADFIEKGLVQLEEYLIRIESNSKL